MQVLFMGTPQFAACSLEALYTAGYDICAVFTQPDKARGRGLKHTASPVKELAIAHGTAVYQPVSLRDSSVSDAIRALAPDLIVVVAYGQILPPEILTLPKLGCINVHASILPRYRGAAPIQWAILNGERTTGVTIMHMATGLDTGDIIATRSAAIAAGETAGQLTERLALLGANLLTNTIPRIADGTAPRIPQDDTLATWASPLTRELSPIDWSRTAVEIANQINGLDPWPVASAPIYDLNLKLYRALPADGSGQAGEVLSVHKDGCVEIACGNGSVRIAELQAPGKKRMAAADCLRGIRRAR